MSWFRRNFDSDEYETIKKEIPFSTVTRWSLYDLSVEYPNEIAVLLGLNPVSAEGDKKEVEDSEDRLSYVEELLPFIDIISELSAKIIVAVQKRDMTKEGIIDEEEFGEEEIEHMTSLYKSIGFSALIAAFSSGLELGIIHTDAISMGEYYKEENE